MKTIGRYGGTTDCAPSEQKTPAYAQVGAALVSAHAGGAASDRAWRRRRRYPRSWRTKLTVRSKANDKSKKQ